MLQHLAELGVLPARSFQVKEHVLDVEVDALLEAGEGFLKLPIPLPGLRGEDVELPTLPDRQVPNLRNQLPQFSLKRFVTRSRGFLLLRQCHLDRLLPISIREFSAESNTEDVLLPHEFFF